MKSLLNKPVFETDAPKPLEIIVFRQKKKKRLIVNVLNYQKQIPPVTAHNIRIKINTQGKKSVRLMQALEEKEIAFEASDDGSIEFQIEKIDMFAMFIIDMIV